jgi:hypothetical protein
VVAKKVNPTNYTLMESVAHLKASGHDASAVEKELELIENALAICEEHVAALLTLKVNPRSRRPGPAGGRSSVFNSKKKGAASVRTTPYGSFKMSGQARGAWGMVGMAGRRSMLHRSGEADGITRSGLLRMLGAGGRLGGNDVDGTAIAYRA